MKKAAFLAISLRVNAIILYAQMGQDDKVDEQYKRLLDFMEKLVTPGDNFG